MGQQTTDGRRQKYEPLPPEATSGPTIGGQYGFQRLLVWRKSMDFVEDAYRATQSWPARELYGLTNQLRRCSVSIAANIAEGQGRSSDGDFARFLSISHGSVREAETLLMISKRLGYTPPGTEQALLAQLGEIGRLLQGLLRSVQRKRDSVD